MRYCKVKCSLCCVQQVRWGLHYGLQQGCASGSFGVRFCCFLWKFPKEEAALGNHSAQSPATVRVAIVEHAMGHCRIKRSICCVQKEWWGLHWGLPQDWAGALWGLQFCRFEKS